MEAISPTEKRLSVAGYTLLLCFLAALLRWISTACDHPEVPMRAQLTLAVACLQLIYVGIAGLYARKRWNVIGPRLHIALVFNATSVLLMMLIVLSNFG
jgi:hypothetical protein